MRNRRLIRILIPMTLAVLAIMLATSFSYATSVQNAKGKINSSSGAILRAKASIASVPRSLLNDNADVTIYKEVFISTTSTKTAYKWYYVKSGGVKGYIRSDLIDNITYTPVKGKITGKVNYRVGPGTLMAKKGALKKGKAVTVYLKATPVASTKGSNSTWYKIKVGSSYRYVCSAYVKITGTVSEDSSKDDVKKEEEQKQDEKKEEEQKQEEQKDDTQPLSDDEFETYLSSQGFPETYKTKLRELHKAHPNWVFIAKNINLDWEKAVAAETRDTYSVIPSSMATKYRATDSKSYNQETGKWIAKCGGGWYNANSQTIAYYMDPRNFLNSDRIYMFEQLSYNGSYQTQEVVSAVLTKKLTDNGFTADLFVTAGEKYNISPVHLAARARQENGSGSACIDGSSYKNTETGEEVVVYNPYNIQATGSNPVQAALKYAYQQGWTSPAIAIEAGAKILANNYISVGQDTLYLQRFYFNSKGAATHQYMQNLIAPYLEANSTKKAYAEYGITEKKLSFVIPIYVDMPDITELPS